MERSRITEKEQTKWRHESQTLMSLKFWWRPPLARLACTCPPALLLSLRALLNGRSSLTSASLAEGHKKGQTMKCTDHLMYAGGPVAQLGRLELGARILVRLYTRTASARQRPLVHDGIPEWRSWAEA